MSRRSVPDRIDRPPIVGGTLGDRIGDAIARLGISNSEAARRIDRADPSSTVTYRKLRRWITGESTPRGEETMRAIAEGLGVSLDELLGVATGQDPPFDSWREFLETPEGAEMSDGERRALQSLAWPPGRAPTVAAYHIALAAVRATVKRPA